RRLSVLRSKPTGFTWGNNMMPFALRAWPRSVLAAPAVLLIAMASSQLPRGAIAAEFGATVDELLAQARQLSPELAAAGLDTEAALARIDAAGAFADPTAKLMSDEVDRTDGGRINKFYYSIEQEIPWWGKRDLRRSIASAEADQVRGRQKSVAVELEMRIKVAFAQYYLAHQSIALTERIHQVFHSHVQLTAARVAQGIGKQQDVLQAELEKTRLLAEVARLQADRAGAAAQINALLGRPADAPLANPVALPPLPSPDALQIDALLDKARRSNPAIITSTAEIAAANDGRRLAEKGWYPDVTVSVGGIDRANGPPGYTAGIGFKIPLQWGARESQVREATAKTAAAETRQRAALVRIQGEIQEALAGLQGARQVEQVLIEKLLPQADLTYRAALASYERSGGELGQVFDLEHQRRRIQVDILKAQAEQRKYLASLERAVGGAQ
ncbi:MAG: TolC family protein, partial [Rhodospirillales bacterium]